MSGRAGRCLAETWPGIVAARGAAIDTRVRADPATDSHVAGAQRAVAAGSGRAAAIARSIDRVAAGLPAVDAGIRTSPVADRGGKPARC